GSRAIPARRPRGGSVRDCDRTGAAATCHDQPSVAASVALPACSSTPAHRLPRSATGEPSWIRTSDLLIKSQLLYRLSYGPTLRRRLPSRAPAGKAVGEMTDPE